MTYVRPKDSLTTAAQSAASPWSARTLGELMQRSAALHTDNTALWVDGSSVTYRELTALASPLARALIDAGLGHGMSRCAVLGARGLTTFSGIIGASLARCAYVPLNPAHPQSRLAAILDAADIDAMIVDHDALACARDLIPNLPRGATILLPNCPSPPDWATGMRHIFLSQADLQPRDLDPFEPGNPDDGAYLLHTSGSTGTPKGIQVRNRNVMAYLRTIAARYAPSPTDRMSQLFDLTFDLSVHDMFLCWGAGAALYCPPARAKFAPRDFVRRHELTTWFSVPSTAATMMGLRMLRPGDFPSLRLSLFCGEALPRRLATAWAAAAPNSEIENLYGPTEATIAITAFRLPREANQLEHLPDVTPIGRALPNQHTALVDADGQAADEGELCLAGTQVTDGYWRRDDLTLQRFVRFPWDDANRIWYRTGDRARSTPEHGLIFLGRLDRQVKIAGYRVELDEVEAVLQRIARANAAAIAWPVSTDGLTRGIIAFVGNVAVPDTTILDECRLLLPPYAVPSSIRRVDEWPVNSNGKTDHSRLRRMME